MARRKGKRVSVIPEERVDRLLGDLFSGCRVAAPGWLRAARLPVREAARARRLAPGPVAVFFTAGLVLGALIFGSARFAVGPPGFAPPVITTGPPAPSAPPAVTPPRGLSAPGPGVARATGESTPRPGKGAAPPEECAPASFWVVFDEVVSLASFPAEVERLAGLLHN